MTRYNTLNINFSNSQLNRLISGIKDATEVTLNLSAKGLAILMMRLLLHINCY